MDDETRIGPAPWRNAGPASDGSTLRLPTPSTSPGLGRPRRGRRRVWLAIGIPVAIVALLIGLDRVAAAIAANVAATKIQSNGFPVKPSVSFEGFPFLTQVITRHFDGVDITANKFPAGPLRASVQIKATDIRMNSGYQSGTVARATGTGLISFSSIASMARAEGAPGLKVTRAGPHRVRLSANLEILSASAIARVTKTGAHQFTISVVSSSGIPASLLGPVRHLTVSIPKLPQGLSVQSVSVTGQGVVLRVSGSNISFGG
jgi:LmeA-like phospholipid-binding